MTILIATPYSDMMDTPKGVELITYYSDILELRHPDQVGLTGLPEIYHCEFSLVSRWGSEEKELLKHMAHVADLGAISFHVLSQYQQVMVNNNAFQGIGTPMPRAALLENCARNLEFIRRLFGAGITLMVENNNNLCTDAYDVVTEANFLSELVVENKIGLLLDIAHAQITALNTGVSKDSYFEGLPLEHVQQIHLSRFVVRNGKGVDAHDALEQEDWQVFMSLARQTPKLEYVTLEYYKDLSLLDGQLRILRGLIKVMGES